ncbi:Crp/Fnr family transcriptional regulator [Pseudotenacibaculum sp. MALMAid0570]|uniref:Crp/Fnr family transcriptional regulator n=1 Tax=Pseudotenacibaculum sp. MALMAid0570 TaxID=3143938 RepID=UPI0032E02B6B
MINKELLIQFGAIQKSYCKNERIFSEQESARYYYQILQGIVKMNNYSEEGKEFIQGIFYKDQSFGEPPLFGAINYPANAETLTDTTILALPKRALFDLLRNNPEIHLNVTKALANRLYYKAIIATEISSHEPEHRVLRYIDYLKYEVHQVEKKFDFQVEHTRQQIADLLGLRVETVIRVIKNLEKKNEVKILNRKVYR